MRTLTNCPEDLRLLLSSWQKSRSIAMESEYFDLMGPHMGLPGLDPWIANDKTGDMLADLADGTKPCDDFTWANLAFIVEQSPTWSMGLILLHKAEMPSRNEAYEIAMKNRATS